VHSAGGEGGGGGACLLFIVFAAVMLDIMGQDILYGMDIFVETGIMS